MFNLEKQERIIVIILVFALAAGIAVMAYRKSHTQASVRIKHFTPFHGMSGLRTSPSGRININTASAEELARLGGIGRVLAVRIVEYRQKNGIFLSKEEIKKVSGIGEALFSRIKEEITTE